MNPEFFREIDNFVTSTSDDISLRDDNSMVIVGPDKKQHLDSAGFEIVKFLYEKRTGAEKTVEMIHEKYGTKKDIIVKDLSEIVKSLTTLMRAGENIRIDTQPAEDTPRLAGYPSSAAVALTRLCQNRCEFCHSSGSRRGTETAEMSAQQVKLIIDKLQSVVKISSVSFTGGEPSMRNDLPEIIEYSTKKGMKTDLITNGIKCSDPDFVNKLSGSGLRSARVSLESDDELIHNRITGNIESYRKTVRGIHNLLNAGIPVLVHASICRENRAHLIPLVRFVKDEFGAGSLSMNVIYSSPGHADDNELFSSGYSSVSAIIEPVRDFCEELNIRLIWASPAPHCIFNPADYTPGKKLSACVSGLLSINSAGDVIPCPGHNRWVGNMLDDPFADIWKRIESLYFRGKKNIPVICKNCGLKVLCERENPFLHTDPDSLRESKKADGKIPLLWKLIR